MMQRGGVLPGKHVDATAMLLRSIVRAIDPARRAPGPTKPRCRCLQNPALPARAPARNTDRQDFNASHDAAAAAQELLQQRARACLALPPARARTQSMGWGEGIGGAAGSPRRLSSSVPAHRNSALYQKIRMSPGNENTASKVPKTSTLNPQS